MHRSGLGKYSPNLELDLRFNLAHPLNLELDHRLRFRQVESRFIKV
jgi:hypothetical protein